MAQTVVSDRHRPLIYRAVLLLLLAIVVIVTNQSFREQTATTTATLTTTTTAPHTLECHRNPYRSSLNTSLSDMAVLSQKWLADLSHHYETASTKAALTNHMRFQAFEPFGTCETSCVGGACRDDASKIVCGLPSLTKGCVVYSIGGNNNWDFELDLLKKTPCEIHTFDCTGQKSRFQKPNHDRLHFHHICMAAEPVPAPKTCPKNGGWTICGPMMTIQQLQTMLNHTRIDLLKMDIEGFEWPILESWPTLEENDALILPFQILVEVHYKSSFLPLYSRLGRVKSPETPDFATPQEHVTLQEHLLKMGYATVVRDDNSRCPHCTELTLIRFQCPAPQNLHED